MHLLQLKMKMMRPIVAGRPREIIFRNGSGVIFWFMLDFIVKTFNCCVVA